MGKKNISQGVILLIMLIAFTGIVLLYSDFKFTGLVVEGTCTNEIANCTESWECTEWQTCADGAQTRTCTDTNSCGTSCKPAETQACVVNITQEEINETESDLNETQNITSTYCGDGIIQNPNSNGTVEVCDNGATNGQACSPAYNGYCVYCSLECTSVTAQGASCGDGTCNGDEDCTSCSGDCGSCQEEEEEETTTTTTTPPVATPPAPKPATCTPDWKCGEWQECINGTQIRACTDVKTCGISTGMPATKQDCVEVKAETVSKNVQQKRGLFNIVGSAVEGPINVVGGIFTNRTKTLIFSGVVILLVGGFIVARFFLFKRMGIKKLDELIDNLSSGEDEE